MIFPHKRSLRNDDFSRHAISMHYLERRKSLQRHVHPGNNYNDDFSRHGRPAITRQYPHTAHKSSLCNETQSQWNASPFWDMS